MRRQGFGSCVFISLGEVDDQEIVNSKDQVHILHVDDDISFLMISKDVLADLSDFEIDHAYSVDEAFKKLAIGNYDVIVSDYEMPKKDGLDFLKKLREQNNKIPFILFTGKGREEVAIAALNLGADGYIKKQGNPETVYGELAHNILQNAERKKIKQTLLNEQSFSGVLLDNIDAGVVACDSKGKLTLFNRTARKWLGLDPLRIPQKDWAAHYGLYLEDGVTLMNERTVPLARAFRGEAVHEASMVICAKGKPKRQILTNCSPIISQDRKLLGAVEVMLDVTSIKKAEKHLQKNQHLTKKILNTTPNLIYIYDLIKRRNVYCNKVVTDFLDYTPQQIKKMGSKLFANILHPNDAQIIAAHHARFLNAPDNVAFDVEYRMKHANGEWRWLRSRDILFARTKEGVGSQILGICEDITAIRASDLSYRLLAENTRDVIWTLDLDGHFTYVSPSVLQLRGYTPEEVMKQSMVEALTPDSAQVVLEGMQRFTETGAFPSTFFELKQPCKDGSTVLTEVNFTILRDNDGNPISILGVSRDISQRKKTEVALKQSEEEYSSLFSNMVDGLAYCQMIFDEAKKPVDFVYLQINDAFIKITGLKRETVVGKKVTEAIPGIKQANPELIEISGRVALLGQTERFEMFFKPLNIWLRISVYCPKKDYFAAIFEDITQNKKMETEKNSLLHSLNERVKELNSFYGISKIFEKPDIPLEEVMIETVELLPPAMEYSDISSARIVLENREYYTKNFKDSPWKLQADIKVLGKKVGFMEINYLEERPTFAEAIFLKEEKYLIEAIAERLGKIIERYHAEKALRESEQRWATTLSSVGDGVIATDILGQITFMNPTAEKLTGWANAEACKKPFKEVFKIINEKTRLDILDLIAETLKTGLIVGLTKDTALVRKDGSEIPIEDSVAPIKDENDKMTGVVIVFRDRSERKAVEEKLQENRIRAEAMNEKLRISGSMTRHDVRNKLGVMSGTAYLLKKKHAHQADLIDGLNRMEEAITAAGRIFEFSKLYEQLGNEELTYIDVEETIIDAVALFSKLPFKVFNYCSGLRVLADSLLRQMFYNFIDNTKKYGQKTTAIQVHYEKVETGELQLIYEDDGIGIPTENKPKLFTEGFSTSGSTGFGLFLTRKMTEIYGWTITEQGEAGKGAKFVINIPKLNKKGKNNFQIASKETT